MVVGTTVAIVAGATAAIVVGSRPNCRNSGQRSRRNSVLGAAVAIVVLGTTAGIVVAVGTIVAIVAGATAGIVVAQSLQ